VFAFAQQHAPAVGLTQQVPFVDVKAPVLFTGHSQISVVRATTM